MSRFTHVLVLALALWGCDDDSTDAAPGADMGGGAAGEGGGGGAGGVGGEGGAGGAAGEGGVGGEAGAGGEAPEADAGAPDAEPEADAGEPEPMANLDPEYCEAIGMPAAPMQEGAGTYAFGDIAGDFFVRTRNGRWRLSEEWTGCDSYVFLTYFQDLRQVQQGAWAGDQLFDSPIAPFLTDGPRNVHYFFVSFEEDELARNSRMAGLEQRLRDATRDLDEADRVYWKSRFHFVTDRVTEIEGGPGEFINDYLAFAFDPNSRVDLGDRGQAPPPLPWAFGIDRLQQWDAGGNMNAAVGRPPIFNMAAFFGHFYNHMAAMERRALPDGAAEVVLLEETVTARVFTQTVEVPENLDVFDALEFDVRVECKHRNVFACSEWDRIARIDHCSDPECMERSEIVRWITPYWRRGARRWVIDASPFLARLEPGPQTFRIEMGPDWERGTERDARISAIFSTREQPRSVGVERAFGGGGFGAEYNTRDPFEFTPPADASRVELVLILSGHGQDGPQACAEWCDHRHIFTVNDTELPEVKSDDQIGTGLGCGHKANRGVSPGQFGNWSQGRAFWCPGLPVDALRLDLTEHVELGAANTLTYRAALGPGGDPGGGNIALSSYVVWYR